MTGWTVNDLGALCEVVSGVTKNAKRTGPSMREVPYLRVANVQRLRLDLDDVRTILASNSDIEALALQPGDILLNEGGDRDKLGRGWIWEGQLPLCIHQNHVFRARVRHKTIVAPKWIAYFANSDIAQRYFLASGKQTTNLASISSGRLKALPVPLPPLAEQHQIVSAIETHFSRLDAAVASLTRAKANVKRARASVLKAAVEGRLVPTEAALARAEGRDYEPASALLTRILTERRARWAENGRGRYKEPLSPDIDDRAILPEGWTWASVDAVYRNRDGERRPIKRDERVSGPYPYIGASGPIGSIAGFTHDGHFLLVGEDGANLLSRSKPIAFQLRGKAWVNNHAHVLEPLAGVPVAWGELHFNAIDLSRYVTGTAQPKLPQGSMNKIAVPLPPLAEQHRIVAEADRRLSVLDALDATIDANLTRCAKLRQSILKRAFEGRLVPPEAPAKGKTKAPQISLFTEEATA